MQIGKRLGAYEVIAKLGEGGMGEVYRARDTKLDREVALKILPDNVANDPDRLLRFEREAKTLAALNHPQIAQIYAVEALDGAASGRAIVMELVDGEDLGERLARGAIPIDEALPIARQIAEALEAAHDQGIVHRDLKPANVKVRADGTVKVLDFGLAKVLESGSAARDIGPATSPTITTPAMTAAGVILGTAAYMSPEQAKGKIVDRRADIWAFGCVLYEMLTGRRAFAGEDVTDTLTAIMRDTPDVAALPADTPQAVKLLIARCLEKDLRKRLPHIGLARLDLTDTPASILPEQAATRSSRRGIHLISVAAAMMAAAGLGFVAATFRQPASVRAPIVKSTIALPSPEHELVGGDTIALSPDGRKIAFAYPDTNGRRMIWVRSLNSLEAQPVRGSDNGMGPFWSPDSQSLAFSADARLKRVDLADGSVKTITDNALGGCDWNRDDVILFQHSVERRVYRVSAAGGTAQPAPSTEREGFSASYFASFLPDGQHFLFLRSRKVYVSSLAEGTSAQLLLEDVGNAKYAAGHLLFLRETTLFAQPFDPDRLALSGTPLVIAEGIRINTGSGAGSFSVTSNGLLAYVTTDVTPSRLTWFDRTGSAVGALGDPAIISELSLSADGLWAAASIQSSGADDHDIWVFDLRRGVRTRVTRDEADDTAPAISRDGSHVAFSSRRGRVKTLALRAVGSTAATRALTEDPLNKYMQDFSADGKQVLYSRHGGSALHDLFSVASDGKSAPEAVLKTDAHESRGAFSPDGRYIAYESNESGRSEIYLVDYPIRAPGRPVSSAGGAHPRWRRDGKELYYLNGSTVMHVTVTTSASGVELGPPAALFDLGPRVRNLTGGISTGANFYGVAPDGQRFLFAVPQYLAPGTITLVVNWTEELGTKN